MRNAALAALEAAAGKESKDSERYRAPAKRAMLVTDGLPSYSGVRLDSRSTDEGIGKPRAQCVLTLLAQESSS